MSSDVEEFSHAARLGGLRTEALNRFVATQAAVNVLGPPMDKRQFNRVLNDMSSRFTRWLRKADGTDKYAERELRRRVLLMVTEGRTGPHWADDEAAERILNFAEDMYNSITVN